MKRLFAATACFCALGLPQFSFAEEREIEEIIVTATKRGEGIQEVPIAVSAFSGEDLESRGAQDLYALQQVAPSLAVYNSNGNSGQTSVRIRGVGTTGNNPGLEAAVGTFIDGVYRSRSGQAVNDMVDIAQVEILRGPQGTLFGKNTSAGALVFTTKKPEDQFGGYVSLGAGNYDDRKITAAITGPIVDGKLSGRLSGSWRDREGYYKDVETDDAYDKRDRMTIKGQLLWTPTDSFDTRLIADYTDKDEDCCPAKYHFAGPTAAIISNLGGFVNPNKTNDRDVGVDFKPFEEVEDWGISAESNWDVNDITFTNILSYREFEVFQGQDIDFSSADVLLPQFTTTEFENFSFELRGVGSIASVDWLFGVYAYTEDLKTDGSVRVSADGGAYISALLGAGTALIPNYPVGAGYGEEYEQETEGWSIYTRNTWHIDEIWDLTLGLRYSDEQKDGFGIINDAPFGTFIDEPHCTAVPIASLCTNQSFETDRDEQEVTGVVSLAVAVTDYANVYVSYSRGYKAGGFNLDQESVGNIDPATGLFIDGSNFEPEFVDAYEIGLKADWLDGSLTTNVAVFYQDFEDFQLNSFDGLGFVITNLNEVVSQGAEFESSWAINDWAFLTLGATYTDARYGNNVEPDPALPNNFLEGKILTQSALWQGSASIFVERQLGNSDLIGFGSLNYSHRGKVNTGSDLNPIKEQPTTNLYNMSIGVRTTDGRYELTGWGTNLTDEHVDTVVFNSVFQAGSFSTFFAPPRMYGATFKVNFGAG
jgi:iron complex outermembrane receptor protein